MRRILFIILACIAFCGCSSKRKIVERDNTNVKTETQRTEQKNEQQATIDYNTIVDQVVKADETIEIERIIYDTTRRDTLRPAEVIRIRKTKTTATETHTIDTTKVTIDNMEANSIEQSKTDSVTVHQKTEKSSRSAAPLYWVLLSIVGFIVLVLGTYLYIKGRLR